MAQANQIMVATNATIRQAQEYHFNRGNGRQLDKLTEEQRAQIPDRANLADTATHETTAEWGREQGSTKYHHNPSEHELLKADKDARNAPIIIIMGNADGTGRPNQSKIMITADRTEAYGFTTWTEMFGASIKEAAPQRSQNGQKWRPIIKLSNEARDAALDAARETGTQI